MKHFNKKLTANKTATNTEIHTKHVLTILKLFVSACYSLSACDSLILCNLCGPVEIHNEK